MDHNKEERADDGRQTSGDVAVHMRKVLTVNLVPRAFPLKNGWLTVGPRVGLESDFC